MSRTRSPPTRRASTPTFNAAGMPANRLGRAERSGKSMSAVDAAKIWSLNYSTLGACVGLHRVAGLLLGEQLVLPDLGNVLVAIGRSALRRFLLRRFLRCRRGGSHLGAMTVGRHPGSRADHLDGLLGVHAVTEVR